MFWQHKFLCEGCLWPRRQTHPLGSAASGSQLSRQLP